MPRSNGRSATPDASLSARSPRVARAAVAVAAALVFAGCAAPRIVLPEGPGTPLADYAELFDAAAVREDLLAASALGVSGTPAFFVNGRFLSGAVPFEHFTELIDDELARIDGG